MALVNHDRAGAGTPAQERRDSARHRIVHIAVDYPPAVGGISRQVAALGPALCAAGFDVAVLTRSQGATAGTRTDGGVSVHRVRAAARGPLASAHFLGAGWWWLTRLRPRPDLLHAHEPFSSATLALRARRKWKVPAVIEPHSGGLHGNLARLLDKPFGRRRLAAVASADCFIAITRQIHAELVEAGVEPERIVSLPNAVDSDWFAPAGAETVRLRRRELGLAGDGPVFVYTGRLDEVKGIQVLLDAWSLARERLDRGSLVVVGDGSLLSSVEERRAQGVIAVGRVDDVKPYLEAADVFVLPSRGEASSIALLEAMSMALPVVATAVGGTPEIIADGVNGLLVSADAPAAFAAGLTRVMDTANRREYGAEARRTVLRSHRLEHRVERMAGVYRELLRGARRA